VHAPEPLENHHGTNLRLQREPTEKTNSFIK
jgi:hypothetical protein